MIYWEDTISIIMKLFELKNKEVAEYLDVAPSTLSKVKKGTQSPPCNFIAGNVYNKIFNTKNKKSFAYGQNERLLLSNLREIIQNDFPAVYDAMKDCWGEENYTVFVMELLNRTKHDKSKGNKSKRSNSRDKVVQTSDKAMDNACTVEADSPEQAPDESKMSLCEFFCSELDGFSFSIERFLNSDPLALTGYLIEDSIIFVGRIDAQRERDHDFDETLEVNRSIINFIDALKDYLGFLMAYSTNSDAFPNDFHFVNSNSEVIDKANECRGKARDLYEAAKEMAIAEKRKEIRKIFESSPPTALEEYKKKFKTT